MEKLGIRIVTTEELIRRIEKKEDVENYRIIGKYSHLCDYWMRKIDEVKVKDLESGIIIEIV